MKINEFDDISINGQFDTIFREKCDHPSIDWRVMKSLAFNESELHPAVEGGLFRIPIRLFYEFDGRDPNDPQDCISTMQRIVSSWYNDLQFLPEGDRIKYIILAYKLRFYNVHQLTAITKNFDEFAHYFSPHLILEVKHILEFSKELET